MLLTTIFFTVVKKKSFFFQLRVDLWLPLVKYQVITLHSNVALFPFYQEERPRRTCALSAFHKK